MDNEDFNELLKLEAPLIFTSSQVYFSAYSRKWKKSKILLYNFLMQSLKITFHHYKKHKGSASLI